MPCPSTVLEVRFFKTQTGNEPVRKWLTGLPEDYRWTIGTQIKTVQWGWPLGMPLVRKLEKDLWEIRVDLGDATARIFFTIVTSSMVLLHGFIKKSQKTPASDLATAKRRKASL